MNDDQRVLKLEKGWEIIQEGITELINILEANPESPIDANLYMTYMTVYGTIYSMCPPTPPVVDYYEEFYERYEGVCNDYLQSKVLPTIQEKQHAVGGVLMLQELVKR
ncbi:hypothetical protein MKW92_033950, partial [Papaver armeniacum]